MVKPIAKKKSRKGIKTPQFLTKTEHREKILQYAWDKYVMGVTLRDIAVQVFDEFNLERIPSHEIVRQWVSEHGTLKTEKVSKQREDFVRTTLERSQLLSGVFMGIATADNLKVRKMIANNEVIDEGAIKERIEAGKMVLKTEEHLRRVLGVGLSDKGSGEDAGNRESLQNFIINLTQNNVTVNAAVGEAQLGAGDECLDLLDAVVTPVP